MDFLAQTPSGLRFFRFRDPKIVPSELGAPGVAISLEGLRFQGLRVLLKGRRALNRVLGGKGRLRGFLWIPGSPGDPWGAPVASGGSREKQAKVPDRRSGPGRARRGSPGSYLLRWFRTAQG